MRWLRKVSARRIARWLRGDIDEANLLALGDDVRLDLLHAASQRFEAGKFSEAERIYRLLAEIWPKNAADAHIGLGACRQMAGDLDSAIAIYGQVFMESPKNPFALANCAECLLILGRYDEAKVDLAIASEAAASDELRQRIAALLDIASTKESSLKPVPSSVHETRDTLPPPRE